MLGIKKITFFNLNISLSILLLLDIKNLTPLGERILVIAVMNNYIIKINREKYSFSAQWIKNKFN